MLSLDIKLDLVLQPASTDHVELQVTNLPVREYGQLRARLKQLSDNCGGRVLNVRHGAATLRFPNKDSATRCVCCLCELCYFSGASLEACGIMYTAIWL